MRVLVYKRTHTGDPDRETGTFGFFDCMGSVRAWNFGAVIGIGGVGDEPEGHGIAYKLTWIGIGPHKRIVPDKRGPEIQFDHFILDNDKGKDFRKLAPKLAKRIYTKGIRATIIDPEDAEYAEGEKILELAKNALPSPGLTTTARGSRSVSKSVPTRRRKGGC